MSVRHTAEASLRALEEARIRTARPNWDGYGARSIDAISYRDAIRFLRALPTTTPVPDIDVDPDGEVSITWYGEGRDTFSVSVGRNGRLSYSGLYGISQSFGTEWLVSEIPSPIIQNLHRLAESAR
jgi:hypothetical protein